MTEIWNSTLLRTSAPYTRSRRIKTAAWSTAAALLLASSLALTQRTAEPESLSTLILAGRSDRARSLLTAHPNLLLTTDSLGNSPLHLAAATGQKDLVNFLLAHGASPNLRNNNGDTPLALAFNAPRNEIAIVDALLHAGADPAHCTGVVDQQALINED